MTIAVSELQRIGDTTVAAIVRQSVVTGWLPVSFVGSKQPVAVLIHRNETTRAYRPDGTPYALDALDADHPGQRAEFERMAAGLHENDP